VESGPPVNDDWQVRGPQAVEVIISGELILKPGTHAATALAEAGQRLRAMFTDPSTVPGVAPLQIGEDLPLDRLTAVVMATSGVKRVAWSSPVQDVAVPDDGLAVLAGLNLTATEAAEA
jgi:phage-related baseplate assembly protein